MTTPGPARPLQRVLWSGLTSMALMLVLYLAWDWRFWVRHLRAPNDATLLYDIDWYTPRVRIAEGPGRAIPVAAPSDSRFAPTALAQARAYAREKGSYAFIVMADGRLEAEDYDSRFGADTVFDTQSMHKGLLAMVVGALVDRGILDVDRPAADFLPEWRNDPRAAITLRDLLANVSGLDEPSFGEAPWSQAYRLFVGTDVERLVLGIPAKERPRTRYDFNHVNAQVLHAVIVRATGRAYADLVRDYLWTPLGNGAAQVRLDRENGSARVMCCFQTTARSWARIGQMLLDNGRVGDTQVLSEAWVRAMTTPGPLNPHAGFNVIVGRPAARPAPTRSGTTAPQAPAREPVPFAAPDVFYLEGRGGQRTLWIPSRRIVVVRIGPIDFTWDDAAVVNPLLAGLRSPAADAP